MRKIHHVIGTLCVIAMSAAGYAKEPKNLSLAKQTVINYHTSGDYNKDIILTLTQAKKYLDAHIAKKKHANLKPAIVLDIDETALSNYHYLAKLGFGSEDAAILASEIKADDPAIKQTLNFYRYVKKKGIAVFFVTGRTKKESAATIKNLHEVGYSDWNGLIFKPEAYKKLPAWRYKKIVRKSLIHQGYDIIANIGDQKSDLQGGYADKTFKLPNPYYTIV